MGGPDKRRRGEVSRFQRAIDDLDSLLALPAIWAEGERPNTVSAILDTLREGEHSWRSVIDGIPGLTATLSPDGTVEAVNRQIIEYTGQPLEELKNWGTNGTVHPDDLPHVAGIFVKSIAAGDPYYIEQRLRRFDGEYRWFSNRGVPERDGAGRIVRWYVLLVDIDDRKHAEEALAASERRLQATIDTIPTLAWSALPDGSADFFNQHYQDFVGLPHEQLQGAGWASAVHPDDLAGLLGVWQGMIESGKGGEAEARLRRHDGQYRWLLFRTNPVRDEDGTIVKWYGVNIDIEDRKQAEAELRRSHDSYAAAQRLSKTGNFTADVVVDDHVWSDELYRIFEIEPRTKISVQHVRDILHPEDLAEFDSGFQKSAMEGTDFDQVFRIVTSAGQLKYVHARARVIERVEGRPVFIGAIQDVTEARVAEEALNRTRSELAHVARVTALGAVTASIAHEVSQPLAGIITNAGTCLRMLAGEEPDIAGAIETARRTLRDGHRAEEVVTRLRALFSRKPPAIDNFDLNEATLEVVELLSPDLQRNRLTVQLGLDAASSVVRGDRVQLQQVILNLVRNASDAMSALHDRPRTLSITTQNDENNAVLLMVSDVGVGLEPQAIERLFHPFYTTKSDGMGIGLSVSRSIIESHGGRLWAEPNAGPGATFSFSIPGRPDAAAHRLGAVSAPA